MSDPSAAHSIFFGSSKPGFNPESFADGTAKRLVEGVRRLADAGECSGPPHRGSESLTDLGSFTGATRFLIPKASSLETTPYALAADDSLRSILKRYDAALRIALPARVAAFKLKHPCSKLSITLFDPSLRAQQDKFKVVDEACLKGAYDHVPRSLCETPDEYICESLSLDHRSNVCLPLALRSHRLGPLSPNSESKSSHCAISSDTRRLTDKGSLIDRSICFTRTRELTQAHSNLPSGTTEAAVIVSHGKESLDTQLESSIVNTDGQSYGRKLSLHLDARNCM